jgi:hypothetical protein
MAIVDYRLRNETAGRVIEQLRDRAIPHAICTGAATEEMQELFDDALLIRKPFSDGDLEQVVSRLQRTVRSL